MTASFALEEPPRHRAPAPHPTTRPRSSLPPRPQQTSTHSAQSCVREAYASKNRRYSVTPPATNRNPSASGPCVRNAKSISPIRSPCDAGIGSNHSFRSLSHSTPLCTKTSSQSTELHDWNDGLLWPLTSNPTALTSSRLGGEGCVGRWLQRSAKWLRRPGPGASRCCGERSVGTSGHSSEPSLRSSRGGRRACSASCPQAGLRQRSGCAGVLGRGRGRGGSPLSGALSALQRRAGPRPAPAPAAPASR